MRSLERLTIFVSSCLFGLIVRHSLGFSLSKTPKAIPASSSTFLNNKSEEHGCSPTNDDVAACPWTIGSANSGATGTLNRRDLLKGACIAGMTLGITPATAKAEQVSPVAVADSAQLPGGLLDSRVTENVLSPPPYGMEGTDVFYPSYFAGVWGVHSECTEVQAPCGSQLFGGNATLAAARRDIGPQAALSYKARFVPARADAAIADREFNVREIAKSAMGVNSVVDVSMVTPNKFSCLMSPAGAPSLLAIDLIVLARRSENIDDSNFHCSEVVRQIVSPIDQAKPQNTIVPPTQPSGRSILLKEIETVSLYTTGSVGKDGQVKEIRCKQRSATFLLPSQQDPIAQQIWQMARGRPIDVRFYDVTYTKFPPEI